MDLGDYGFGELFHTGLRKGCDSTYSSLIWNIISELPAPVWTEYCTYTVEQLKDVTTEEEFAEAIREWVWQRRQYSWMFIEDTNQLDEEKLGEDPGPKLMESVRKWSIIFSCTLELMDDDTCKSLYYWFKYCLESE